MSRIISLLSLLILSFTNAIYAGSGSGVDVVKPLPIVDPDNISDEYGLNLNLVAASGGSRDSNTVNISYLAKKMSERSNLSLNFYVFDYEFSDAGSVYDSLELGLSVYYTRTIWRTPKNDSWRPYNSSFSYYLGFGYARNEVEGSAIVTGTTDSRFNDLAADPSKTNNAIPFEFGLVGTWSLSPRHGIEAYANVDQHVAIGDTSFNGSYKPTLTFGGDYIFRFKPKNYFPAEVVFGVLFVPEANDVEQDNSLGFRLGYRKRF